MYTGLRELVPEGEQLYSKFNSNCSGVETTNTSLNLVPLIRGLESISFCSLTIICNEGWMMFVCISRASFLFRSWRRMSYPSASGRWNHQYQSVIRQ